MQEYAALIAVNEIYTVNREKCFLLTSCCVDKNPLKFLNVNYMKYCCQVFVCLSQFQIMKAPILCICRYDVILLVSVSCMGSTTGVGGPDLPKICTDP